MSWDILEAERRRPYGATGLQYRRAHSPWCRKNGLALLVCPQNWKGGACHEPFYNLAAGVDWARCMILSSRYDLLWLAGILWNAICSDAIFFLPQRQQVITNLVSLEQNFFFVFNKSVHICSSFDLKKRIKSLWFTSYDPDKKWPVWASFWCQQA